MATAVASEPPRPSVVISLLAAETPWKPATMTTSPLSRWSLTRKARTSSISARPWTVLVMMPACDPVRLTASTPRSRMAMARRAMEMRSPAVSSMSISRGWSLGLTWRESSTN